MIKKEDLSKIKKYLEESENPLFFFDNDPDGLCSYLLFKKFLDKGKGVVIKGTPKLDLVYVRKVKEYCPDKVFILDKPIVTQEFIDAVNVPIIWVDHHTPLKRKGIHYFNPRIENKNDNKPVTYWCYKVVNNKENLWIALLGCVADWFLPDFAEEFSKEYPDLLSSKLKDLGDINFKTDLGKLVRIFSFLLKGKTSDVNRCINVLLKIESPYEILNQTTPRGKFLYKRAEWVGKKYQPLLEKALQTKPDGKLFLFTYPSGKMSFSNDLANELMYRFSDKLIVVAREKNGEMKASLRSKKHFLPPIVEKALKDVEGYGGGHEHACGGNIAKKDFGKFVEVIKKEIE